MIRILFICHGNICRSPIAEAIMKNMVKKEHLEDCFEIVSRATSREELGNDIYPPARRELEAHNVPYDRYRRASIMTRADYDAYDYLIGMDERNIGNIFRIIGEDPEGKVYKLLDIAGMPGDIEDPYYSGNFHKVWNQIEEGCRGFLKYLKENK
ncbi:MAG: low molecular weight protein-tyrosine-phosphatase, partial [Lachnospiraceae bacterium]|nr:low molecular weight protein-tyrosine-phosphatase [Lachnospiraceae bacterium]